MNPEELAIQFIRHDPVPFEESAGTYVRLWNGRYEPTGQWENKIMTKQEFMKQFRRDNR